MTHKIDLEELLGKKDEEISLLEGRLSAYTARISVLQSRLVTSLDTLDAVQNSHVQEIAAMSHKMERLRDQLRLYADVVKSAERERDDMRDAVHDLVEKVESFNEYRNWPRSHINISSHTDPFLEKPFKQNRTSEDDELLLYAASIIDGLRRERDKERKSHTQSLALAEARVLAIEAKLSRREAELELCAAHADHAGVPLELESELTNVRDEPMNSDQVISILDLTLARNKVLEVEIKSLFKRLEDARAASISNSSDITPNAGSSPSGRRNGSEQGINTAAMEEPAPSQPIERDDVSRRTNDRESFGDNHQIITDLDRQIRGLGDKINAFREERILLCQKVSRTVPIQKQPIDNDQTTGVGSRVLSLENACNQLRQSEHVLRGELEATRASAAARETELLEEIARLKGAGNADQDETIHGPNLLDSSDGEESMELATPLLPISHMSVQSTSPTPSSPGSSSDLNSQPASPRSVTSLPIEPWTGSDVMSPATPDIPDVVFNDQLSPMTPPLHLVAELQRVETVMDGTQRQVASETALDGLADLIAELHG